MGPQLLVVEDDPDSLEMLALVLESYGFGVTIAQRSQIARDALVHASFELVIADLMVDSRDPAVCWRDIDELVSLARPTPVGLLTSWPTKPVEIAGHGLAFSLPKPCTTEQLLAQIARVLDVPPLAPEEDLLIRAYFEYLAHGDIEALVAQCTEDIVYAVPSTNRAIRGRDAFRSYSTDTLARFRGVTFDLHEIRPLPRGAIVRYTGRWSGGEASASIGFILDRGRIAEIGVRTADVLP
jgi:CheY-like chemotaxis protein